MEYFHSVTLEEEKCVGCTDCIKRCPTEAIRVREGKAQITSDRCIDCGLCIDVCRHHAKKATTDPLRVIQAFPYKVAIPAPTLYAQFQDIHDVNRILTGLKRLGFDEVFEVCRAAEAVTAVSKEFMKTAERRPVISSACPAVTRLISIKFPSLIDNILPMISPMEATARAARSYLEKQGIKKEDIGIFFISPCAAKVTNVRRPIDLESSSVDGVISMQEIYIKLRILMKALKPIEIEPLCQSGGNGIFWAAIGGEGKLLEIDNAISVDGVENVMKVLELMENGQLGNVDFVEALACTGGCLGGALTVSNNFVAKNNLVKVQKNTALYAKEQCRDVDFCYSQIDFCSMQKISAGSAMNLDEDLSQAIQKLSAITELYKGMPQIDCGSCGAPTCMALAEDIVQGKAQLEDCVFMLRKKVRKLAEDMVSLSEKLPPSIR